MIRTEKILHLKNNRGRRLRVVREHYLREEVPCYSSVCQAGCPNGTVFTELPQNQHNTEYMYIYIVVAAQPSFTLFKKNIFIKQKITFT